MYMTSFSFYVGAFSEGLDVDFKILNNRLGSESKTGKYFNRTKLHSGSTLDSVLMILVCVWYMSFLFNIKSVKQNALYMIAHLATLSVWFGILFLMETFMKEINMKNTSLSDHFAFNAVRSK